MIVDDGESLPTVRYRSLTLLVALLIALLVVICAVAIFISWTTHQTPTQKFIRAIRQTVPKNASVDQLESAVGPGTPVGQPKWVRDLANQFPERFPDGLEKSDTYLMYNFPDLNACFQIRNGQLVNHNPADFADADSDTILTIK